MISNNDTIVLIPCAGKGSRSNLKYPKTFYSINKKKILHRIIDSFKNYNFDIKIVINIKDLNLFQSHAKNYSKKIEYLFQNNANGMGNAVLKIVNSKNYKHIKDIILIWGDIPFIKIKTIDNMIKNHIKNENDFTFVTGNSKNPYTQVLRDKNNKVINVIENKNKKNKIKYGERDIGLFIFKKKYVIKTLQDLKKKNKSNNELGFLNVIKSLYKLNLKIEGINIANEKEMKSLNYIGDLK